MILPETVIRVVPDPGEDWDAYVSQHPRAEIYHRQGWPLILRSVFKSEVFFLEARDGQGRLVGVLPLVKQRGALLGGFMTSIPYFNYGGALADQEGVHLALMDFARGLAKASGCSYLELRNVHSVQCDWPLRSDKVTMIRALPANIDELWKELGSKLRSQIRRPDRENPVAEIGGGELLDHFYRVFLRNMHALGTPAHPKRFFAALLSEFAEACRIVVVRRNGEPMAAGFLVINGTKMEIPWAACVEDAKSRGYNMKLYWECMALAISIGCTAFDFGRCTVDGGTFRFKRQWGARPVQLHWYRWNKRHVGASGQEVARGRLFGVAGEVWKRMPQRVVDRIGPLISPRLPW